jgi:hypothetical protein
MYTKQNRLVSHLVGAGLAGIILGMASSTPGAAQQPVSRFTAVAVNMLATTPGAGTTPVNIVINRWSTDAEHDRIVNTVLEQGEAALAKTLEDMTPVGSVAPTGGVGFDLHYASHGKNADGVEQIVLLTNRPMSFWERRDAGRSTDYRFTMIELRIRPSGEGEGKVQAAAGLSVDRVNRTLLLDSYHDQPVALRGVKRMQ